MNNAPPQKLGLSLDPATLSALKSQAGSVPKTALHQAAKQFESLFVNMMLKSMRAATPQEGATDSEQTRLFTGMLDEQYAQGLSQGRGLGLAALIEKQLSRQLGGPAVEGSAVSGASGGASASDPAWRGSPVSAASPAAPTHPRSPAAFKSAMAAHAEAASAATGIPAEFLLAQAGLESGWGQHQPHANGVLSHNLFGIKAGANWHGKVVQVATTEYINGVAQRVTQPFRAYDSYAAAFHDYAQLLTGNARYARALHADSGQSFAGALQKAGYATDPHYAAKLARAIRLGRGISV